MVDFVFQIWPEQIAEPIAEEVHEVLTIPRTGVLTISGLFTIYFASNGVEALRVSLNRAYGCREKRSLIFCYLQNISFVIVSALIIILTSVLLIFVPIIIDKAGWQAGGFLENSFLRFLVAFIAIMSGVFLCYKYLPNLKQRILGLLPGVSFVLIMWLGGSYFFTLYLASFANYFSTYAGLTSIVICMGFLYIMGTIFILGAYLNAAILIEKRYRKKNKKRIKK